MSGGWYFDGEGCQGGDQAAVITESLPLGPRGDALGDSPRFPAVAASEESALSVFLLLTHSAPAAALLTESTSTPSSPRLPVPQQAPSCHFSISAFITLYICIFFFPGEMLLLSLLFNTSSIFIIINVILIQ